MPGRGQPWKGVGKGNPDRIGTNAIADGSITEADLDSSVQAKLNSGGGVSRDTVADPFTDFWIYDEFFYPFFADGDDQFSHFEVDAGTKSVPSNQLGGVVQLTTTAGTDADVRINTCGSGLVAVNVNKIFRVVWRINK